jgi:hypothetical protein
MSMMGQLMKPKKTEITGVNYSSEIFTSILVKTYTVNTVHTFFMFSKSRSFAFR